MSAWRQLAALLALRWAMLRTASAKTSAVVCAAGVLWLLTLAVRADSLADDTVVNTVLEIAPGVFLGFAVLALIAPVTAGGGHEVVPQDQLVAFPVTSRTQFLGGLVLAPVNLVWAANLLVIAGMTALLTFGDGAPLAWLTTLSYVVAVTLLGQAVAWLIVGARQTRQGRRSVTAALCLLALGTPFALQAGWGDTFLNSGPSFRVVLAVIAGGAVRWAEWAPTTLVLVVVAAVAAVGGVRACSWALRRPSDLRSTATLRSVRRRGTPRSELLAVLAVDRASAWRAPALRRGGVVILVLPGLVAATLQVPWESLVVMPGLVAAGAGLLFGINAFALDGSGAVWLSSLPARPMLLLASKLIVVSETVAASVFVAASVGALRSNQAPTAAEVASMVGAGVACTAVVVALCLHASVRRPSRADLRGPRDAVAPPGALAAASARLALPCALIAMAIAASASADAAWFPLLVALPFTLMAALSLLRSMRFYADPHRRAGIVQAVSAG